MEAIVTVKLAKDEPQYPDAKTPIIMDVAKKMNISVIDIPLAHHHEDEQIEAKPRGECPLSLDRKHICTDVEGQHHSYIEYGTSIDDIIKKAERRYGHVTRVEEIHNFCPSFTELYQASIYNVYSDIIDQFFQGKKYFTEVAPWMMEEKPISRGGIWVSKHKGFETLTVEPKDGGQYEIAVRMPHEGREAFYTHSGYSINDFGTFSGYDTSGH